MSDLKSPNNKRGNEIDRFIIKTPNRLDSKNGKDHKNRSEEINLSMARKELIR